MTDLSSIPPLLLERTCVAFDTETTGLWAVTNRIVEIGAIKFQLGLPEFETFQFLVNPLRPIPPEAIQVHGITNEMVAVAEPIKPVLERFTRFCGEDSIMVAHNAPFDISFVGCELDRVGLPLGTNPILDTVDIFRRLYPGLPSYSLLSLVRQFGIAESQDHRALADAVFVKKLLELAITKFPPIGSPDDLATAFSVHRMSTWSGDEFELSDEYSDFRVAVEGGMALEIQYESPDRGPELRVIWPKRLHARGATIYVTAYCEKASAERTFRLDRISRFRITSA